MKKKLTGRLELNRETIRELTDSQLERVIGAGCTQVIDQNTNCLSGLVSPGPTCSWPQTCICPG